MRFRRDPSSGLIVPVRERIRAPEFARPRARFYMPGVNSARPAATPSAPGPDVTAGQTYTGSAELSDLANCFDDNSATRNGATAILTVNVSHITVQFSATRAIRQFTMQAGQDLTGYMWQSGKLMYSDDGSGFTQATTFTGANNNSVQTFLSPDVGAHIHWRLVPTAAVFAGGGGGIAMAEIEMMEYV